MGAMIQDRVAAFLFYLAAVCLIAAEAPSVARADVETIRLGVIGSAMHLFEAVPLSIAQQKGMLDRQGIKLDVTPLAGVGHMITELDDGHVDISSTAMPYLISGVINRSDAVGVVGGPANTIYSLVARPDITSFADLKGRLVGMSLPVDIISIGARALLARHGLAATDYTARPLVGTPLRATCLDSGDCAAVPLNQPDDILFARRGYHILGNSHEVIPTMQFTVFAARRRWANEHRDAVIRFARAMGDAYRMMADPSHRDEVIATAAMVTGGVPDLVAQIYQLYYEPDAGVFPKHAEISMAGVATVIELLGRSGQLSEPLPVAENFIDLQFLAAAGLQ